MHVSRVHSVIAGATLAAVLAGSSLVATAEAAPKPADSSTQHVAQPGAVLPAADPSTVLTVLGNLGAVQNAIAQLTALAQAKPAPSAAEVQAAAAKVTAAITDLQKSIPTKVPVVGRDTPAAAPTDAIGDALTKLQGDVTSLVSALTAVPADLTKVTAALTAIVADLLAVVTQTVASLGLSLPVPLPVTQH
ncbi:hypothetical protein [Streptacidiphilus neutrinimicus]|uniref:hypothetical protein n=1 Tax=Streptacidiphilus neutrinimicus TaxID=105420 RepID=UPI0006946A4B|nr:hypothetical protein [Streptacidiphilus neutrinimicus]